MRQIVFSVRVTIFVSMLALAFVTAYGAEKYETIDQLKARFESAHLEDRPELGIRIAQHQLRSADSLYGDGNIDLAVAAVEDIVTYSEKASDAATQTKKHSKNIEIDVRKIADKLRDIKRTLAFEDQPPVDKAIRRLEDIRTAMLKEMFAKDKKKDR
jgi:hypothetical protein